MAWPFSPNIIDHQAHVNPDQSRNSGRDKLWSSLLREGFKTSATERITENQNQI